MFWLGLIIVIIAMIVIMWGFIFTDDVIIFASTLFGGIVFIVLGSILIVKYGITIQ